MTTPDSNPFPNINICPPPFEGVKRAIQRVKDLGRVTELCLSEHITDEPERGAEAMLAPHPGEVGGVAITGYLADANLES